MRFEFDSEGYVSCILYGCSTGSCVEYTGLVPSEPEAYEDMDDWADRAQVQAYYLNDQGNLIYDADRAASIPAEDYVEIPRYTSDHIKQLGILDTVYPVGSIYMSVNDVSPALLFGGTWERIEDKFLLAAGSSHYAGEEGGAESHEHIAPIGYESSSKYFGTININGNTSEFDAVGGYNTVQRDTGGTSLPDGIVAYYTETVEHLPPYLTVYVWQRVADVDYVNLLDSDGDTVTDANANEVMVASTSGTGAAYQSKHTGEEIDAGIDAANKALEQIQNLSLTPGADGKSAYEIALDNGFEGTEEEWLASLKGDTGEHGNRGSVWFSGTHITGTSTVTVSDDFAEEVQVNDYYLNTSTCDVYQYMYIYDMVNFTSTEDWVYIGNIKGAKGSPGDSSAWFTGTGITGTSASPTVFSNSGVTHARINDLYLNTSTGNVYSCYSSGTPTSATWVYTCNIKGAKGATGAAGADGYTPVRGVDYWTEADKQEIINTVLAALSGSSSSSTAVLGKAILGKMKLGGS